MEHHNRRARDRLSRYLRNKRVVIVGPASSIIGSKQGKLIDSYDVVIRLNKALPVPAKLQEDIGSRTDILYNCMNPSDECGGPISISILKRKGVRFLIGAYPPIEKMGNLRMRLKKDVQDFFAKNRLRYQNFCYTDKGHFQKLWRQLRLPNTGVMAITDLLRFKIKELYITGITFFKGGYYSQYRPYDEKGILEHMKKFGLHRPQKQLKYMATELSNDTRVKMDSALKQIVETTLAEPPEPEVPETPQEAQETPQEEAQEAQETPQEEVQETPQEDVQETPQEEVQAAPQELSEDPQEEVTKTSDSDELSNYSDGTLENFSSHSVNLYAKS